VVIDEELLQRFLNWRSGFKKTLTSFSVDHNKQEISISYNLHALSRTIQKVYKIADIMNFVANERIKRFRKIDWKDDDFCDI
jgi:hypothetical protein